MCCNVQGNLPCHPYVFEKWCLRTEEGWGKHAEAKPQCYWLSFGGRQCIPLTSVHKLICATRLCHNTATIATEASRTGQTAEFVLIRGLDPKTVEPCARIVYRINVCMCVCMCVYGSSVCSWSVTLVTHILPHKRFLIDYAAVTLCLISEWFPKLQKGDKNMHTISYYCNILLLTLNYTGGPWGAIKIHSGQIVPPSGHKWNSVLEKGHFTLCSQRQPVMHSGLKPPPITRDLNAKGF